MALGGDLDVVDEMMSTMLVSTTTRDGPALDFVFASNMIPHPRWAVSGDGVTLSTVASPDKVGAAIDVLADIALRPAFEAKAFERVRDYDARLIDERSADAGTVAEHVLLRALFGAHPYGSFQTGQRTRAVSRSAVLALHARVFRPERLALILAGKLTRADVEAPLNAGFGNASGSGATEPVSFAAPVLAPGPRLVVVNTPGATIATIAAGFVGPPPGASDAEATETAMSGIARAPIGRLTRRVRDDLGLVPWLNVIVWWQRSGTILGLETRTPSTRVATVLTEADRTLRAVASDG
jgi:zinc protease